MANTFEKVLQIISKKPEQRQDFEIQGLLPWLRKKSKLFSTLKTVYLKDIVRNCSVGKYRHDDVIIRQGEVGDCFYIILAGKISIYIINKDKEGSTGDGEEKDAFAAIGTRTKEGQLDRSKLGNFVTSLGTGFPFGEVALASEDAVRAASIVAEEETDLLVVDRALYNRAVRDVLAAEFEEKQYFIKENELFSSWIPKYKKQLTMAMYKETFPYDSVLVKQGETVNNIYFIVSGQVEIRCDTALHQIQYPKMFKLLEDEREKLIKEKRRKTLSQSAENMVPPPPIPKKKDGFNKLLKLCYHGKNESLGQIEVLMDMDTYMTTAVCTEKTEVLVLEMKHYERLFVKKHQRTIDAMRKVLEKKLATRTAVLKEYDAVPLLKLLQIKLHQLHNPPVTPDDKKKKRPENSVQIAEKLFFNHQGPLLDIEGPGSVFYMIRAREKSRLRLQAHQKERNNARQRRQNGHIHSLRLPQSLLMAANMAGAAESEDKNIDSDSGNDVSYQLSKPRDTYVEIETVAKGNTPIPEDDSVEAELLTDRTVDNSDSDNVQETTSKPVRRIQSAAKGTSRSVEFDVHRNAGQDDYRINSVPSSRPLTRLETFKTETKLRHLEYKVAEWLWKDNPKSVPNVSKLRRIQVEEMEPPPKPGNRIVIRRRHRGHHIDISEECDKQTGSNSPRTLSQQTKSSFAKVSRSDDSLDRFRILLAN